MVATNSNLESSHPTAAPGVEKLTASKIEAIHDAELVRRFNAGDEDAFTEIVVRYRGRMFSVALCHLRNHADAEEIAQDTFIRAHRGLAAFRGDSSLATWLHRIAFNLSRNRYKYNSCRRRQPALSLDCAFIDGNQSTLADMIASDAPSPAREATYCEFNELVSTCMAKLTERQRRILMLRNAFNQSYRDIARELGISVGTVKSRIGRARENLRALLSEAYPDVGSEEAGFKWFEQIRSLGLVETACA